MSAITNYEQLWNSFKAARENIEPQKTNAAEKNDELYNEIVFVDPKSDHETIVQLCSQCSFRTWDRVEFEVHSNYHERLKHTNIGEKSGKLTQNPSKKQVSN